MKTKGLFNGIAILTALALAACSSSNDPATNTSTLNPDAPDAENTGTPGGDITPISGLWDGTMVIDDVSDVIYWNLAADGVLTRYDFQQDGMPTATGENCYIVDNPVTVTPESDEDYSIFDVAVAVVRNGDTLTITFNEADKNDLNQNDDIAETPVLSWTLLTTPTLADLNACTTATATATATEAADADADALNSNDALSAASDDEQSPIPDSSPQPGNQISGIPPTETPGSGDLTVSSPPMSRAQCGLIGGTVIGDIGNGAIHRADYRCESGQPPTARITYLEGEPIASEGEVCCV